MCLCKAKQYNDEMHCGRCGLVWDVNDPEPPKCLPKEDLLRAKGRDKIRALKARITL